MSDEPKVNRDLVKLLESVLADAKSGRVVAGAVVAVLGPSSAVAFSAMGAHPLEIIGAAKLLQDDVGAKLREAMAARNRVLRPSLPGLPGGSPLRQ
jgi:hypothetical protein